MDCLRRTQIRLPVLPVVSLWRREQYCKPGNFQSDLKPLWFVHKGNHVEKKKKKGSANLKRHVYPPDGAVLTERCASPPEHISDVRSSCEKHIKWQLCDRPIKLIMPLLSNVAMEINMTKYTHVIYLFPGSVIFLFAGEQKWTHWWNSQLQLSLFQLGATERHPGPLFTVPLCLI